MFYSVRYFIYPTITSRYSGATNKGGHMAADDKQQREGISRKGGQSQGKNNNPGNFANDRKKASEAGKKGGEH